MLRPLNKTLFLLSAALFVSVAIFGSDLSGQQPAKGPGEEIGLKVGESAPDFTLKNQNGEDVKLSDLTKNGLVAVVFHRSASW